MAEGFFSTFILNIVFFCTGKLLLNLMDHTDIVRDLTFAPDGSLVLVSASRDKTLRVWDLKDDGEDQILILYLVPLPLFFFVFF